MSEISFEKDLAHHPLHYFALLCLMAVGLWGLFWFDYDRLVQMAIVVGLALAYVAWGVIHHFLHRDLHVKIIFEYLLVAILTVLIFVSLLFRT